MKLFPETIPKLVLNSYYFCQILLPSDKSSKKTSLFHTKTKKKLQHKQQRNSLADNHNGAE
jgi:hypothetical protein